MPEITHYEIVNGGKSDKEDYPVTVNNEADIRHHKDKLRKELDIGEDYDIFFHLKMTQSERNRLRLSG
jgi:hypothetical protein